MFDYRVFTLLIGLVFVGVSVAEETDEKYSPSTFAGLKFRSIGPALMSGRIADIALHPDDPNTWYVAVGSGGVWKTHNSGTTWTPLFDKQPSYSIGCVTLDPSNPHTVWVGTGENVGGRHVGIGDGIYKSEDGGTSWTRMGLEDSEHISRIIVHPDDSDTLWVAAQGPLWASGGQRGLYKSTDGGASWRRTLGDDEWTGVTDVVADPRDPDLLYAATWQHHRTVAAYVSGGPKTGIYRSTDGGETWSELKRGLPEGNMGKIGLAISPQKPDVLYAAIELDRRTGGVYRSADRGASWKKQSDTVAGATGPHYYQELYASPHAFDRIYHANNRLLVSNDGGKTFEQVNSEHKHGDDHAVAFRPDNENYLLVGSDGGLYESFDLAENWRYIANLPVTQFYKVAVDDDEPFYNVYGGTQDNATQGGPSRTDNLHGIRNSDWFLTVFGDGHQPATEPGNPDIVYSEWQEGNLIRHDRRTGEIVYIQPQGDAGDPGERFNWDAPILVSPHSPTRLYFASQRVWRSDNRGDDWTAISGDLTLDQERMLLPLMGRQQSWDAPWDMLAMSAYNTITSLAESPLQEGLIYAGTDDGLIQVTDNGGESWRRIEVGDLPGVPDGAFVNDIKADLYDADTVYVALDHHKFGDFSPYLLKSTDRGRRWRSIAGDLPDRHLVWRVVQDHVNPNLLFSATEYGIFFTLDGGQRWVELNGGVPTISFRDLAIQRRENDLVGASFGRGFYILDDYSPLRDLTPQALDNTALLFPARKAWWYIPRRTLGGNVKATQGAGFYTADNPPFGATFTYYLAEDLTTREKRRQKAEKPRIEAGEDTPFPGWEAVEQERREPDPMLWLTIRDSDDNVVRRISAPGKKGVHRATWDLRFPSTSAIGTRSMFGDDEPTGFLAAPGQYTATLASQVDGQTTPLAGPVSFLVDRLRQGTLEGAEPEAVVAFWQRLSRMQRDATAAGQAIAAARDKMKLLSTALSRSRSAPDGLDREHYEISQALEDIATALSGPPSAEPVGHIVPDTVSARLSAAMIGTMYSTYGPTPMLERNVDIAEDQFAGLRSRLNDLLESRIPDLEQALLEAGAPWTPGRSVPGE